MLDIKSKTLTGAISSNTKFDSDLGIEVISPTSDQKIKVTVDNKIKHEILKWISISRVDPLIIDIHSNVKYHDICTDNTITFYLFGKSKKLLTFTGITEGQYLNITESGKSHKICFNPIDTDLEKIYQNLHKRR